MPWPSRGSLTSVAISAPPGDVATLLGCGDQAMQGRRERRWRHHRRGRGRPWMWLPGGALIRLVDGAEDRLQHVLRVRDDELLHHRGERQRRELRADALDRRVEPVEGLVLQDPRALGAEAHPRPGLVRDDRAVRLLHGTDERLLVERLKRA